MLGPIVISSMLALADSRLGGLIGALFSLFRAECTVGVGRETGPIELPCRAWL